MLEGSSISYKNSRKLYSALLDIYQKINKKNPDPKDVTAAALALIALKNDMHF